MSDIISETTESTYELLQLLKNKEVPLCDKKDAILSHLKKYSSTNEKVDEFNKDLEWFNVSRPLTLNEDLKGKVVILDFFTYCCINCLHILPQLKVIEKEFSVEDGVVVIGVHSAKFDNEKDSANLLSAVQRYEINHPVVNDSDTIIWTKMGISCWPTLLILSPAAQPLFLIPGEGFKEELLLLTRTTLMYYKSLSKESDERQIEEINRSCISKHSLPVAPSVHLLPPSLLLFPGKVATCEDILAISDTGHNRILITSTNGNVKLIIGGPSPGFLDGNAAEARFYSPQGIVFFGPEILFVADTENHAIRKIDISQGGKVSTIAGTGIQGNDYVGGKQSTEQSLNSPWDLTLVKMPKNFIEENNTEEVVEREVLLIAMAGSHQIWAYFLEDTHWWRGKIYSKGQCVAVAGSGAEENRNNNYPHAAAFAQPSGICYSPECVFVADSESSTIRRIWLLDGKVTPVVGGAIDPQMLFAFGDKDGKGRLVRLQHPLGVAFSDGKVYLTDTYNHKVKVIHVGRDGGVLEASAKTIQTAPKDECITVVGDGHPGDLTGHLGTSQLNEPGGLCISAESPIIFVADTNNHCIKKIDLTKNVVEKIRISYMEANSSLMEDLRSDVCKVVRISPHGGTLTICPKISLSKDLSFAEGAPQKMSLIYPKNDSEGKWPCDTNNNLTKLGDGEFIPVRILIPPGKIDSQSVIKVKFNLYVCRKGDSCMAKSFIASLSIVRAEQDLPDQSVDVKYVIC